MASRSIDQNTPHACCCKCRFCSGAEKHEDEEEHGCCCCARLCQTARALWLEQQQQHGDSCGMKQVEELYRQVWNREGGPPSAEDPVARPLCKKARLLLDEEKDDDKYYCCPDQRQQAGEKLALIYLQSDRAKQADKILVRLGFTCRLARSILDYEYDSSSSTTLENARAGDAKSSSDTIPCCIYDDFLSNSERSLLQSIFLDPTNSYWINHNYTVEPPSPYFSYLLPLFSSQPDDEDSGGGGREGLRSLVYRLRDFLAQHHSEQFPNVEKAQYVELWAHNRPHATGHQFHFDSDNEGCPTDGAAVIRNPICSCVLFLTDGSAAGGPSVVTNQRLASRHLATRGWMCPAAVNRLLAFDGKVLHGVIPGKQQRQQSPSHPSAPTRSQTQPASARRVTVMLAFWRRIRVRGDNEEGRPGAARLLPTQPEWARQLRAPLAREATTTTATTMPVAKQPIQVTPVYESVPDGAPWTRQKGLPDYEQMFQGF